MTRPWERLRGEMLDNVVIGVDELRDDRDAMLAAAGTFDETKIRRYPKGTKKRGREGGGRFAPKGATAKRDEKEERDDPVVTVVEDQARFRQTLAKANEPEPASYDWPDVLPENREALGLGDARDSQGAHTDAQGRYTPERLALHDEIIGKFLLEAEPVRDAAPTSLFMAGGSGSGKTTVLRQIEDLPPNAVLINPDDVKELLPEYRALVEAGDSAAASYTHEESSDISKKLLQTVNERGYNAIIDGTGDSGVGKFYEKIAAARSGGRQVRVVLVDIPIDLAVERAMKRAQRTGRMVPEVEIRRVHKAVSTNFIDWQEKVDDWELWANEDKPRMVARRSRVRP